MAGTSADSLVLARAAKIGESLARTFAIFFIAATVFLQGYAIQTHIHGAPAGFAAWPAKVALADIDTAKQLNNSHRPVPSNSDDCPFCQAAFNTNAVFLPAPVIFAPMQIYLRLYQPIVQHAYYAHYRGHDQEQRGPPTS